MRIEIDIYRVSPELEEKITQDEVIFYETIKEQIRARLSPLKDDIEKEESDAETNNTPAPFIEITILKEPTGVKFHNYSKELSKKMQESFSLSDGKVIDQKIDETLKARNN